ncbi:hypothetical protein FEK35_07335 [Nocardia cyriacigeorgica]|uniref:DUF2127 domain-containing protein n=2 Tax=Nocardia cyriacigeorgica TaxID=135487 RepID=A0A5R8PHL3_9NOCA|nr:hypothetical protein FEK35_07335 [Nocardia cyriacigeorgica]
MNMPKPPGADPAPVMPEDVGTARQLWWAAIAVGLVQLIASVITAIGQRDSFTEDMLEQARATDPQFSEATAELMVTIAFALVVVFGLVIAGIGLLVVHQLARGKAWARAVLTFAGVWLVFMAIGSLFALDAVSGIASLVAGGAAIVQGVLAAGAIYLSHRPDSTRYFQMNRR